MSKLLKTQKDLHLSRKLFHSGCLLSIFFCMLYFSPKQNWLLFMVMGVPPIIIDLLRHQWPKLNQVFFKVVHPLLREYEMTGLSGFTYAAIAVAICYTLFPKPICLLAILFLALGDPLASLFGLRFGKIKIFRQKSLIGTAAAWITCSLATVFFIYFQPQYFAPMSVINLFGLSLICGGIGAISEVISIFSLDDNLTQPLMSGILLSLYFWQVGGVIYG